MQSSRGEKWITLNFDDTNENNLYLNSLINVGFQQNSWPALAWSDWTEESKLGAWIFSHDLHKPNNKSNLETSEKFRTEHLFLALKCTVSTSTLPCIHLENLYKYIILWSLRSFGTWVSQNCVEIKEELITFLD